MIDSFVSELCKFVFILNACYNAGVFFMEKRR
nr:MAG TPA: hypothetical protein [Caudoviricetes sp.]